MNREIKSQNPPQPEIPTPVEESHKFLIQTKDRLLTQLQEGYSDCFTQKELDRISKNPNSLYFFLSSHANKILKKKGVAGIEKLQDIALPLMVIQSRIEKVRKEKAIKFPAEKPPLFARIRRLPKFIQVLLLASSIAGAAFALEAGRRLVAAPEEAGIKTTESAGAETPKKPEGVICTGKTCLFVPGIIDRAAAEENFGTFKEETRNFSPQEASNPLVSATSDFLTQRVATSRELPESPQ